MFSRIVRRTHMYLALFLAPWMIGYAVSTIAMQHRMPRPTAFVTEREQVYPNTSEPGRRRAKSHSRSLPISISRARLESGPSA